jgi:tripartite-type tricarboxylate transporter receptor subunit TctC
MCAGAWSMVMKRPRNFLHPAVVLAAICALSLALSGGVGWSQTRTIKIVVPVPAGGVADVVARVLAEHVSRAYGPAIVVENRPGAGTIIGSEAVARAAPDGNTLLLTSPPLIINPHLRKLNYDPLKGFEPICHLTSSPMVIVVNSASSYRTLDDLLAAARARPGSLTLGSLPAGVAQIAFEKLKRAANIDMTFVPFGGDAPVVNALMGQHLTSAFITYPGAAAQLKVGTLRALAAGSRIRTEAMPEVPTVAESGFKDYEADFWNGLLAPAKTPKPMIFELAGWFTAATQSAEVRAKLAPLGLAPAGACGADFGALLQKQYDDYGRVIREANIKAE